MHSQKTSKKTFPKIDFGLQVGLRKPPEIHQKSKKMPNISEFLEIHRKFADISRNFIGERATERAEDDDDDALVCFRDQ